MLLRGAELLAAAWALVGLAWTQVAGQNTRMKAKCGKRKWAGAWLTSGCFDKEPPNGGQPVATNQCAKECSKFQEKEVPLRLLKSYEKLTCRAKTAVLFITVKGKEFCARPEATWVQKRVRELDAKAEASAESEKVSGDVVPTPTLAVDLSRSPASTSITFPLVGRGPGDPVEGSLASGGPETATLPRMTTSKPEAKTAWSTLQPTFLAKEGVAPQTTNGPVELGEGFTPTEKALRDFLASTHPWTGAPTSLASTILSRPAGNTPVGFPTQPTAHPSSSALSRYITSTTTPVTPPTASPSRPSSSSPPSSVQRTSSTGTSPQSTAGIITGVDLSGQSTTEPGWGERDIKDQATAVMHSTVPAGRGSEPTWLPETGTGASTKRPALGPSSTFHQEGFNEKNRAWGTGNPAEVTQAIFPSGLAAYRTHLISMGFVAGLVSISSAVGVYWVYAKSSTCGGRKCAKGVVQGLMSAPSHSEAESYLMENI